MEDTIDISFPRERSTRQPLRETRNKTTELFGCSAVLCHKEFLDESSLREHEKQHRPWKCKSCNQQFVNKGTLKSHIHRYSKQCRKMGKKSLSISPVPSSGFDGSPETSNSSKKYCCSNCSFQTDWNFNLVRHKKFSCTSSGPKSNSSSSNGGVEGNKSLLSNGAYLEDQVMHFEQSDISSSHSISQNKTCSLRDQFRQVKKRMVRNIQQPQECTVCGIKLNYWNQNKHNERCFWKAPIGIDNDKLTYLSYKNLNQTDKDIFLRLSATDGVDICKLFKLAIPGIYPLICSQVHRQKLLNDICNKDNVHIIKKYLREKSELKLPKHIMLKFNEKNLYIGPDLTRISQRMLERNFLELDETESCFIIRKQQNIEDEESDDDLADVDNDNEEIEQNDREEILDLDQLMEVLLSTNEGRERNEPSTERLQYSNEETTAGILPPIERMIPLTEEVQTSTLGMFPSNEEITTVRNDFDIIFSSTMVEQEPDNETSYNQPDEAMVSEPMEESNEENINEGINITSAEEGSGVSTEEGINASTEEGNNASTEEGNNASTEEGNNASTEEGNNASTEEGNNASTEENDIPSESNEFSERTNTLPREKMKYINIFLHPELCASEDIRNLIHISKDQFLDFVNAIRSHLEKLQRHLDLSVFSLALLFRMKLAKCKSFAELSTLFVISKSTARRVYRKVLHIVYRYHSAIPNILSGPDTIEKLFEDAAQGMDPFFKALFTPFEDPKGEGRIGIPFCIDGTYQPFVKSSDNQINKQFYYIPYGGHVIKLILVCTPEPKIVYVCPNASSETPASGDGNLLGNLLRMQEEFSQEALRLLARGSSKYFPVFVCDTGFQVSGNVTLPEDRYKDFRKVVFEEKAIFLGTKKDEYLLRWNSETKKLYKIPYDPQLETAVHNTIKFIRFLRCKNENVHAALKQKFQILNRELPISYLKPFYNNSNISHYTILSVVCCSLYNLEHPGYPVRWLKEDQKVWKANQILNLLNRENFLQHLNLLLTKNWKKVKPSEIWENYNIRHLNATNFHQIAEIVHGIHASRKGVQVASQLRKREVHLTYEGDDLEEYRNLIRQPLASLDVFVKRLNVKPAGYSALENMNVLPTWSGSGYLFYVECFPSNRTDKVKKNHKFPCIFLLDNETANPFGCTDVFKRVGGYFCYNCPSMNGTIGACSHLGFFFQLLFCPYSLCIKSTNIAVAALNIKNPFNCMHPGEALQYVEETIDIPSQVPRLSEEKRPNDQYYFMDKIRRQGHFGQETWIREEVNNIVIDADTRVETDNNDNVDANASELREDVVENVQEVSVPTAVIPAVPSAPAESTSNLPLGYYGRSQSNVLRFMNIQTRASPELVIPNPSSSVCEYGSFDFDSLQPGFYNPAGSNICYLNSLFFLLHRIQIIKLMYDDHGCEDNVLGLFRLILLAMPSESSFNVTLFINTWNNVKRPIFKVGEQEDPGELLECFLNEYGTRFHKDSLSTFEVALECKHCGSMQSDKHYDMHHRFPMLDISDDPNNTTVNLFDRFDAFINAEDIIDKCKVCKKVGFAKRKEVKGRVRIIRVNRNKNVNRVPLKSHARVNLSGFNNILSCILHTG